MMNLQFERLTFLDTVQHCFTDGGPGGGHLIPSQIAAVRETSDELQGIKIALGGMYFAGRDDNVARGNAFYTRTQELIELSPYELRQRKLDDWERRYLDDLPGKQYRYPLLWAMLPSLTRAGALAYRVKASHEATVTVLALKRWRLEKGEYPPSLNELLSNGYLKKLPADPYSAGPLKYHKRGDGFVLYSVGGDFTDDGGIRGTPTYKGWFPRRNWEQEGADVLFWPPSLADPNARGAP